MKRHCDFWLPKKKRYCKFVPYPEGSNYCPTHTPSDLAAPEQQRVPCPVDPRHTVLASEVEKHVKKCPYLPFRSDGKPYHKEDINAGDALQCEKETEPQEGIRSLTAEQFDEIRQLVERLYEQVPLEVSDTAAPVEVVGNAKHTTQHTAIVEHLRRAGLLRPESVFLEFGAGKGHLSLAVCQAAKGSRAVLVDRKNFRRKADLQAQYADGVKDFQRIYADLKDLWLPGVDTIRGQKCVVISKHLCGCATDLALRCMNNYDDKEESAPVIEGAAVALCCHHICTERAYVSTAFLHKAGISPATFLCIKQFSSWAVCNIREPTAPAAPATAEKETGSDATSDAKKQSESSNQPDPSGLPPTEGPAEPPVPAVPEFPWATKLTVAERQEFGRKCKRVLDLGRLEYLREKGYSAKLIQFVAPNVTPENVLLLCWKPAGAVPS
eukprot:TRINITY_DN5035_c0_g1_i1.p1 TRINITY_DN5035_c0_g1~~TRINITY_DN5035_c0_g1_i1.p1  ORF type:complete len:438 (-),score=60.60 TRINITY_DN5035_c0_g1_i1:4-1317(-)